VVVVVFVEDGVGWVGACDLIFVGGVDLLEVGSGDEFVLPDVGCEGFSCDVDVEAGGFDVKGNLARECVVGKGDGQQNKCNG